MMNKEQKKQYISDMSTQFDKSEAVIVTHYQGLTVSQLDELRKQMREHGIKFKICLLYTSPSPRDNRTSRMPSSA